MQVSYFLFFKVLIFFINPISNVEIDIDSTSCLTSTKLLCRRMVHSIFFIDLKIWSHRT